MYEFDRYRTLQKDLILALRVLVIMAYTGRFCLKGALFSGFRYIKH